MKSKLLIFAGIVFLLVASQMCSPAQSAAGAGAFGPGPSIDPTTGQPIIPAPEWKDSNWKDPDITLTNVLYDGIQLVEVARLLNAQFKEQFDILLPGDTSGVIYINNQTVPAGWEHDWRTELIQLRLKNVTASEIFAAMNLLFENNRTPLRWELKVNGHRQIALLRVLVEPTPVNPSVTGGIPDMQRRVYFVGNLIGDEKNGGMTMEQIIKTVTDVWKMADTSSGNIQFHKEAQLLVVTGTSSQIDFMEQTLKALGQRLDQAEIDRARISSVRETLKAVEQKAPKEKTNSGAPPR